MKSFFLFLILVGGLPVFGESPICPESHCSLVDPTLNSVCVGAGFAGRGFPVVRVNMPMCYCPCSCVVEGTYFQLSNLEWKQTNYLQQIKSLINPITGLSSENYEPTRSYVEEYWVSRIDFDDNSSIAVSENHTFVTPDERVVSAKDLQRGDQILSSLGAPVAIGAISRELYKGFLYNVIINSGSKNSIDHIVSTNGVMSGDLLLQSAKDFVESGIYLRTTPIPTFEGEQK